MPLRPRLPLAVFALVATIAFHSRAQDISPDSPKGAASAFFKAMESGDAKAARAVAVGSEKQLAMLDLLVPVFGEFKKLENAAVKKWGEEARKGLSQDGQGGPDFDKQLKAATEKTDGDSATISPPDNRDPIRLKKVDGRWKVDMGMLKVDEMDVADASKKWRLMSDAARSTAAEVEQGKYATPVDARKALEQKLSPVLPQKEPTQAPPGTPQQPKK